MKNEERPETHFHPSVCSAAAWTSIKEIENEESSSQFSILNFHSGGFMNVKQVIEQTAAWVEQQGRQIPGFYGAHLMGSILSMPPDSPFPAYRDVDFNIVVRDEAHATETHDVAYNGLILEYSTISIARYRSPEDVLSNPELAANLAVNGILADPHGILAPLHQAVAEQYAQRRWVLARCGYEQQVAMQALAGTRQAGSPPEAIWLLSSMALFLAGLLAEASLRPPTHRRCLVLLRDVLHAAGRRDLHEATLQLLGWAHLRQQEVEAYLGDCALAFDHAVAVTRTPVPFQFKLQPHVRPYIIAGAQEMIDQGYHREAMFWIGGFLMFANSAIQADAPSAEKPYFQAMLDRLVAEMGLGTPAAIAARAREAEDLAGAIVAVADALVEQRTLQIADCRLQIAD
jgi:hypothetical protein